MCRPACSLPQLPPHQAPTRKAEEGVGAVGGVCQGPRLQLLHHRVCLGAQQAKHAGLAADVHHLHLRQGQGQRGWGGRAAAVWECQAGASVQKMDGRA